MILYRLFLIAFYIFEVISYRINYDSLITQSSSWIYFLQSIQSKVYSENKIMILNQIKKKEDLKH